MREELGRRAGNAEAYRELALRTDDAYKDLVLTLLAPAGGLNIHERTRGPASSTTPARPVEDWRAATATEADYKTLTRADCQGSETSARPKNPE